jgi:16S rRNA processing protein RimM
MKQSSDYIHLGEISGVFGVRGWVKVFSHTRPRENIVTYKVWRLGAGADKSVKVLNGRRQGKGVIACLEGVNYADEARRLIGTEIYIKRSQLAKLGKDEYYWSELEGLSVVTTTGFDLGKIAWLFETGNNDVLVVKGDRERYIPYITDDVVISVDLQTEQMVVDWDPDF